MRDLDPLHFDISKCMTDLTEFETLLKTDELEENKHILPFFRSHLHISAFVASYVPTVVRFDRIKHEFALFGDFRSDLVVGDATNNSFCFVEFEDAMRDSVFVDKGRSTKEWSSRFEHGFSQIVDWFWKVDDLKNSAQARSVFGTENFDAYGILVIGRDQFISSIDRARLSWRLNKVLIDSRKIICITFDQLARDLRDRLSLYSLAYHAEKEADIQDSADRT